MNILEFFVEINAKFLTQIPMQTIYSANRAKREFFEHFTLELMQNCHPNAQID